MKKFLFLLPIIFLVSCGGYYQPTTGSSTAVKKTAEEMEKEEFEELMVLDSINKNQTAAESLDILLSDTDDGNKISLIVNNNTNCNIILRFAGDKYYNLPIYKNRKNFIVIEKGTYSLGANLCKSRYSSYIPLTQSTTFTLSEASAK